MDSDERIQVEEPAGSAAAWPRVNQRGRDMYPTGWVRVFDLGSGAARNIGTGHGRGVMAVGQGAVWTANGWSRTVARLDLRTLEVSAVWKLRKVPVAIAVGTDAIWVVCSNGWLWRIWPEGTRAEGIARLGSRTRAIAASGPWIWALREKGTLVRVEPATGEVTLETALGRGARQMVADDRTLWVTRGHGRKLLRVDGDSGAIVTEIRPPRRTVCLTAQTGTVWIGCRRRSSAKKGWLYAVDGQTLSIGSPLELPGRPRAVAAELDRVWVACAPRGRRQGAIQRFDRGTGELTTHRPTDWPVYDLAIAADSLLATMGLSIQSTFDGGGIFDVAGGGGSSGEGGGG